jgi:y4mF family transcriptional regulator
MTQLGQVIRTRRKELGLTQEELAMRCGCARRYISELEQGKETARVGMALRTLHMLKLDVDVSERGRHL